MPMVISPATLLLTGSAQPERNSGTDIARAGESGGMKSYSIDVLLACSRMAWHRWYYCWWILTKAAGIPCARGLKGRCNSEQPEFGSRARSELAGWMWGCRAVGDVHVSVKLREE